METRRGDVEAYLIWPLYVSIIIIIISIISWWTLLRTVGRVYHKQKTRGDVARDGGEGRRDGDGGT